MMDISDLQVFKTVVDSGGISRAAEQLHRVPSNVTARIQKLEQALQQPLFLREKNRLKITPAGKRLLVYAEQMLRLRQQAIDDLTDPAPSGTLRIGSMESTSAAHLPPILSAYHREFSEVDIELRTGASGTLVELVLEGELDVALAADPVRDDRLCMNPCFEEQLLIVKPAALSQSCGVAELPAPLSVVTFTQGCSYRNRIQRWLDGGNRRPDRTIEIPSHHTMLACVLAGMGIALVPRAVLALHPQFEELATEDPGADISRATTWLIWRKDSTLPSISAFRDTIDRHLKATASDNRKDDVTPA
ncbi:LysR substrate-binding domain-containing protein [Marinobacterium sedimentorum]|uniref:LysR substrate-binding domain-containing protein n=1 Tax=Marinobacterium sedimentorum TaxID=2927804 RepID=UPI0020C736B0|nr:LysR substrate-binding domain-containing protein [Marinobacterium sedimentorum]MCP8688297.1 LysR substrate-binding domain-containing protein [Marinobacterium sedimentorum]